LPRAMPKAQAAGHVSAGFGILLAVADFIAP